MVLDFEKKLIAFLDTNLLNIVQTIVFVWIRINLEHSTNAKDRRHHNDSSVVAC